MDVILQSVKVIVSPGRQTILSVPECYATVGRGKERERERDRDRS